MKLFPIGTIAGASSQGTIDSISYSMFEPNLRCSSNPIFNVLTTMFETKIMLTRKKALPYLVLSYEYGDIFDREFRQIQHFIEDVDESLSSFYLIDFSKGRKPSSVSESSGDWIVSIDNTKLFSTISNQKSHQAVLWDGKNWKLGDVISISTNTSITVDFGGDNFGDLVVTEASGNAYVYPVYTVYIQQNSLNNFKVTNNIPQNITLTEDGGFMWSGNLSFTSKYKI